MEYPSFYTILVCDNWMVLHQYKRFFALVKVRWQIGRTALSGSGHAEASGGEECKKQSAQRREKGDCAAKE